MKLRPIEKLKAISAYRYARRKNLNKKLNNIKYGSEEKPKMSMSKKLTIFLLINFTIVEIYSLIMMFYFRDLSNLSCLISSIAGETVTLISYNIKSTIENKTGGITYEVAMNKMNENNDKCEG